MTEIKDMTIEEVEARALEIEKETESADEARLDEFKSELEALEERKNELKRLADEAAEERKAVAEGSTPIVEEKSVIQEERKMTNSEVIKSVES